jgi:hypothetical protein
MVYECRSDGEMVLGKQISEERSEQGCGVAVREFVGAESEDLVARQLHRAVFGTILL